MPDPTISNTSPIYYLHRLDHLDLLEKIYGEIVIPNAVLEELDEGKKRVKISLMSESSHG